MPNDLYSLMIKYTYFIVLQYGYKRDQLIASGPCCAAIC